MRFVGSLRDRAVRHDGMHSVLKGKEVGDVKDLATMLKPSFAQLPAVLVPVFFVTSRSAAFCVSNASSQLFIQVLQILVVGFVILQAVVVLVAVLQCVV